MKRIKFFVAGFLVWMVLTGQAQTETPTDSSKKGFGISISPSVIRLTAKPGQSQRATIRVLNNSATSTRVVTEVSDVGNRVENGMLVREFPPPGTLPFSCAKWTLLQDSEFLLTHDEYKDVTFLVSPPADRTGGFACVVFFRGIPVVDKPAAGQSTEAQATIQIQPRLGGMIFYEIEGTIKRTGNLLSLAYEPPTAQAPLRILYLFKNTGNADILITGTFYILDENKVLAAKGDLKSVRTFPGDEGSAETEWSGTLSPGKYKLVVTFELGPGAQEVIVKELELTIP